MSKSIVRLEEGKIKKVFLSRGLFWSGFHLDEFKNGLDSFRENSAVCDLEIKLRHNRKNSSSQDWIRFKEGILSKHFLYVYNGSRGQRISFLSQNQEL